MFPAGYCAEPGVGEWMLMIGSWVALLAVVVWAITRLFPTAPRGDFRSVDQPLDAGWVLPARPTNPTDAQASVRLPRPDSFVRAGRN